MYRKSEEMEVPGEVKLDVLARKRKSPPRRLWKY